MEEQKHPEGRGRADSKDLRQKAQNFDSYADDVGDAEVLGSFEFHMRNSSVWSLFLHF